MEINEALRKHEARIMQLANVAGIGVAEKDGKPVIRVFVSRKLPKAELGHGQVVPASLEGYPPDVEEIGIVMAQPGLPS